MSNKIVLGYDDSEAAKSALAFAVSLAKAQGAELVIAHVLEWSPYSFLTPEEIEQRHKRREEELKRAEDALLAPVRKSLEDDGVTVSTELKYGHIAETLIDVIKKSGANHLIIGRTGHSALSSRLFGSVAGSLAQAAPVPVTIVP
ncbi:MULTISPECIES: universal stress protein [unclassified Leisingera]|uniref:universal stress protein n=1 Tax=unclassified Leisingera TaxID=2614906 RepID=UPI0002DAAA6E|nr:MULTISPECIES: universal stress protein [unclassified Leisingera]KIC22284.1 universal stress protein [Leisingera sp. ANG-S3]KIC27614.1 universal stress protein [Leisingera sp. ANG-M6]KIC53531.1 universal stress protein [Leisingera sp. ANG-S]KID07927.1 universal stress protein [Leisingera sp. ANG1]